MNSSMRGFAEFILGCSVASCILPKPVGNVVLVTTAFFIMVAIFLAELHIEDGNVLWSSSVALYLGIAFLGVSSVWMLGLDQAFYLAFVPGLAVMCLAVMYNLVRAAYDVLLSFQLFWE